MMQVRRVKSSDLKLEHQILDVPNLVNLDVPVIVDKEMRVIFGDMMSLKLPELDVLVVDLPFEDTRLAMHSVGRWSEPNWSELDPCRAKACGYTAFIDHFLFKEVPASVEADRRPDKGSTGEELF